MQLESLFRMRVGVVCILAMAGFAGAVPTIAWPANDASPAAITAGSEGQVNKAGAVLRPVFLSEPPKRLKDEIAGGLRDLAIKHPLPEADAADLRQAIGNTEWRVFPGWSYVRAIGNYGIKAVPVIEKCMVSQDDNLRCQALVALDYVLRFRLVVPEKDESFDDLILKLFLRSTRDRNSDVRGLAVMGMDVYWGVNDRELPDEYKAAIAELAEKDTNPEVRDTARHIKGQVGTPLPKPKVKSAVPADPKAAGLQVAAPGKSIYLTQPSKQLKDDISKGLAELKKTHPLPEQDIEVVLAMFDDVSRRGWSLKETDAMEKRGFSAIHAVARGLESSDASRRDRAVGGLLTLHYLYCVNQEQDLDACRQLIRKLFLLAVCDSDPDVRYSAISGIRDMARSNRKTVTTDTKACIKHIADSDSNVNVRRSARSVAKELGIPLTSADASGDEGRSTYVSPEETAMCAKSVYLVEPSKQLKADISKGLAELKKTYPLSEEDVYRVNDLFEEVADGNWTDERMAAMKTYGVSAIHGVARGLQSKYISLHRPATKGLQQLYVFFTAVKVWEGLTAADRLLTSNLAIDLFQLATCDVDPDVRSEGMWGICAVVKTARIAIPADARACIEGTAKNDPNEGVRRTARLVGGELGLAVPFVHSDVIRGLSD